MAERTRSRVEPFTAPLSLRTADTVALETPACLATSLIVARVALMVSNGIERSNRFEHSRTSSGGARLPVGRAAVKVRPGLWPDPTGLRGSSLDNGPQRWY